MRFVLDLDLLWCSRLLTGGLSRFFAEDAEPLRSARLKGGWGMSALHQLPPRTLYQMDSHYVTRVTGLALGDVFVKAGRRDALIWSWGL